MIPQIKEINFPSYATLSSATATLNDMGDKIITAQVKLDGVFTPDFSYDWEIEFQGERYIQPLREPQASKGNESIYSTIDLTFYHKGIYDLKRYFFVSVVELEAGTIMADNYITSLRLNLGDFVTYLSNVISYYFGNSYVVKLDPNYEYESTDLKDISINYTKIWDVVTKIYEWYGVHWQIKTGLDGTIGISIGYGVPEVSHIFEYGFEGGLLKFERQVQDQEIANVVFGRGSSENIPYRYFKNKSEDNPTFPADPDWIPELENVYFANLRGKTFRDYVQGWKTNPNRDTLNGKLPIEVLDMKKWVEDEAYKKGHEDATFNPIEYVKDDNSIYKYGEIQKGLEHNEDIKPTIQGVTIDGIGRVDQIVDVEPILVDESTENIEGESKVEDMDYTSVTSNFDIWKYDSLTITLYSNSFTIPQGHKGSFLKDYNISAVQRSKCSVSYYKYGIEMDYIGGETKTIDHNLALEIKKVEVVDETNTPLDNIVNIEGGTTVKVKYVIVVSGFLRRDSEVIRDYPNYENTPIQAVIEAADLASINVSSAWQLDYTPIHGQILGNYVSGATRKSQTVTIPSKGQDQVVFITERFTISEKNAPATSVEMPYRITSSIKGGAYDPRPNVVAINVETGEQMTSLNLPAGTYYLQNSIQIDNFASEQQTFKVELLPTYIYYSYESTSWKPTFDIWVKNIWGTMPEKGEKDYTYEHRIWDAILGNHLGNEAKVVFSSGWLSGHSDWEFLIADTPKRDTSKTIDGVPSEWRITLYKSDAEVEATGKWLPSIMTQASAGDHFFFTGIEMPHQYVLWAEEKLDKYKEAELAKVCDVKSTIAVHLDRIRMEQKSESGTRPLLDSLRIGNNIKVADSRFIRAPYESLSIQSVTYTWDANTIMLPNVEVILSDKVYSTTNIIKKLESEVSRLEADILQAKADASSQHKSTLRNVRSIKSNANNIKAETLGLQDLAQANRTYLDTLRGTDYDMSVREIAEDVVASSGGGGGGTNKEALDIYINELKTSYDGSVAKSVTLYAPQSPPSTHYQIFAGINKSVGWSDIKTINGISILGSGDIKTSENLTIKTTEEDTPMSYILEADTILVFTKEQTQGSVFMVRKRDLNDENEHKWGVRFKVADNNTGSYSVTSDGFSISWKDGRVFTAQNGGYYDVLLHYKDDVLYGEYSAYGDIATPSTSESDVYIADFTLRDMTATADKPIDFDSLFTATKDDKIILVRSGVGSSISCMVATTKYMKRTVDSPAKIYISVTDGTTIYNSTALRDSASIDGSANTQSTIATEEYVTNVVGDINTLLETIIAG